MGKTIAAVATPEGLGGIGVVRISGDNAIMVADKVFKSVSGKELSEQNGYTALFGHIVDDGNTVDEAVALVFRAPKSYTGEDTVELSVHGGSFVVKKVLRAVLSAGAQMAERGEFTRRAFENGKINLTEAEAVADIISADGEQALRASMAAKNGAIFKKCSEIKENLTFACATVAAFSDFPDEEPEFSGIDRLEQMLCEAENSLDRLCEDYDTGRMIRHGINTVIVGPPNAGKSTLMNLLVGCERSIVTSIAGTTRDIIEETVNLQGVTLKLSDTAGLRETDDEVEQIGVRLTKEKIDTADLIIAVLDSANSEKTEIAQLLDGIKGRPAVVVFNKSDLNSADTDLANSRGLHFVEMSAKEGSGIEKFVETVKLITGTANLTGEQNVYLNERQRDCAMRALNAVREALEALQCGMTIDAVGVCLDDALNALYELSGERVTVEVANKVFEHFCVGK
ncbi:MAG: tRNA uridine-5-carboxymethylaminomethyl(34) synthesis GTPase MnmE [Clostridia bacterium]|nr:tRNA uridine-5-carboxymethylaminomethyl(34) synthesis GTPase MnmE [Clostridia bacterium]